MITNFNKVSLTVAFFYNPVFFNPIVNRFRTYSNFFSPFIYGPCFFIIHIYVIYCLKNTPLIALVYAISGGNMFLTMKCKYIALFSHFKYFLEFFMIIFLISSTNDSLPIMKLSEISLSHALMIEQDLSLAF